MPSKVSESSRNIHCSKPKQAFQGLTTGVDLRNGAISKRHRRSSASRWHTRPAKAPTVRIDRYVIRSTRTSSSARSPAVLSASALDKIDGLVAGEPGNRRYRAPEGSRPSRRASESFLGRRRFSADASAEYSSAVGPLSRWYKTKQAGR